MAGKLITLFYLTLLAATLGMLFSGPASAASPCVCRYASPAKFIDGRLNDWREPFITIDQWNWRPNPEWAPVYGGGGDLSATLRLAWDTDNLYLAVVVRDDFFLPAKTGPIVGGDAVLLTLAPSVVSKEAKVSPIEFAFTLSTVAVVCKRDTHGKWTPCREARLGIGRSLLPAPTPPMPHEDGKGEAKRITKICYELALPWTLLPDTAPKEGASFGMTLQVLDTDDGKTQRGSLKWRGATGVPLTATGYGQVQLDAKK